VACGRISLDEANLAREKVKDAIDRGYRKPLTVMMVDLAGSSKIKLPGETLIADRAFRDYRTSINGVLKDHGCTSFDWSGDGAICIFSEPLPAVQAAVRIQGLVEEIATRHPQLPARLLARIGINTGEVYLDPRRGLGEFASRTVDQAGHLEKDCPPGAVLVSEATMEHTKSSLSYASEGVNRDGIGVYRVLLEGAPTIGTGQPTVEMPATIGVASRWEPPLPATSCSPARVAAACSTTIPAALCSAAWKACALAASRPFTTCCARPTRSGWETTASRCRTCRRPTPSWWG
jgi:class 3 adenylate cyclase